MNASHVFKFLADSRRYFLAAIECAQASLPTMAAQSGKPSSSLNEGATDRNAALADSIPGEAQGRAERRQLAGRSCIFGLPPQYA